MADPRILGRIIQLGKELGANISNSLGTRTNVNFLGTGPKDGMLFQKDINPESFLAIGTEKILPDIESSIAYASGNKLNGFQLTQLEKNLTTMKESLSPTNVVEMGTGGIDSLRAKSGIGERQATKIAGEGDEAARDIASIDRSTDELNAAAENDGFIGKMKTQYENAVIDKTNKMPGRENENFELLQRSLRDSGDGVTAANMVKRQGGTPEEQKALFEKLRLTNLQEPSSVKLVDDFVPAGDEAATGIMQTVDKGDLPGKTAASREFLVNALKKENPNQTSFVDIVDPADRKFIMEGGGGVDADPIVLVQKYFGPRIAEMIPNGGTTEEIAIFTKRVMDNVEDAKGFKPDEPEFDTMTARFIDEFTPSEGGQPFAQGGLAKILEL